MTRSALQPWRRRFLCRIRRGDYGSDRGVRAMGAVGAFPHDTATHVGPPPRPGGSDPRVRWGCFITVMAILTFLGGCWWCSGSDTPPKRVTSSVVALSVASGKCENRASPPASLSGPLDPNRDDQDHDSHDHLPWWIAAECPCDGVKRRLRWSSRCPGDREGALRVTPRGVLTASAACVSRRRSRVESSRPNCRLRVSVRSG